MLTSILPNPKHTYNRDSESDEAKNDAVESHSALSNSSIKAKVLPSYPNRKGFIPVDLDDFGDGGAYPELHVVQYPLNMGKPGMKSSAVVSIDVDEKGQVRYDAIVKQGTNRSKLVQTSINDLKEKAATDNGLVLPTEEEELAVAEKTKLALEQLLHGKINAAKPLNAAHAKEAEPTYIRYTPNPDAPGYKAGAQQRVIKLVEAQVDPMEPPRHQFKKVPQGPPEDPVPILHSPPRKLTVADQQAWKIPPSVSNWKNAKGFIIPLDKRLAADGRGLQEITINNKFATLTEALYVAERKAAEDLRIRNQIRKKTALQEKEDREKDLREMALKARMERSGTISGTTLEERSYYQPGQRDESPEGGRPDYYDNRSDHEEDLEEEPDDDETEEARRERLMREKLRIERRKERERELRLENMKGNMKRSKADRDEGRDISEKIALGLHKGTGKLTGEAMFDSRLFNQSAGVSSGFGADDEYSTYTKPLFDRGEAASIYRPKKGDDDVYGDADAQLAKLSDTSKFRPDKGFKGAEGGASAGPRDAPVQFERPRDDGSKRARYEE